MKNFLKFLSFVVLFSALISESFAIDAPANLKLDSTSGTTVNLSWDEVEWAIMYYVYFWKNSWTINWYEVQSDLLENNSTTISDLEEWSTYYFSAVALDDNASESDFSNELVVDVAWTQTITPVQIEESTWTTEVQNVDFALDSVKVVWYNKIELTFTNPIDSSEDTLRDFKITNINDNLDTFEVISSEINIEDPSKILLTLDRDTEIWNEYNVVILAITSASWNTIESWIDNIEAFTVTEIVPETIELNSAAEIEVAGPTWANVDADTIENTTLALAEKNTKLPQTWPEHIFMLILSIILWALIFVFKYKKA